MKMMMPATFVTKTVLFCYRQSEPEPPKDLESFVMEKQIQTVAKTYEGNLKLNAVMVKFEDEAGWPRPQT